MSLDSDFLTSGSSEIPDESLYSSSEEFPLSEEEKKAHEAATSAGIAQGESPSSKIPVERKNIPTAVNQESPIVLPKAGQALTIPPPTEPLPLPPVPTEALPLPPVPTEALPVPPLRTALSRPLSKPPGRPPPPPSRPVWLDNLERKFKEGNPEGLKELIEEIVADPTISFEARGHKLAMILQMGGERIEDPPLRKALYLAFAEGFTLRADVLKQIVVQDHCPLEFFQEAAKIIAASSFDGADFILEKERVLNLCDKQSLIEILDGAAEVNGEAVMRYLEGQISEDREIPTEIKDKAFRTLLIQCRHILVDGSKENKAQEASLSLYLALPKITPLPRHFLSDLILDSFQMLKTEGQENSKAFHELCDSLLQQDEQNFMQAIDERRDLPDEFLIFAAKLLAARSSATAEFVVYYLERIHLKDNVFIKNESALLEVLHEIAVSYPTVLISSLKQLDLASIKNKKEVFALAAALATGKNRQWVIDHLADFGIDEKQRTIFIRHTSAAGRLRQVVKEKVMPLSKGLRQEGAKMMHPFYWMEASTMRIAIGDKTYEGHIRPHAYANAFAAWQNNKAYLQKYSFEEYLNQIYIPKLSETEKGQLIKDMQLVHFFKDEELATLTPSLGTDGSIAMPNGYMGEWARSQMEGGESQDYNVYLKQAKLQEPPPNAPLPTGNYIFTVNNDGALHLTYKKGNIYHSSLTGGQPSRTAGQLSIENRGERSVITHIIPWSGHYKPDLGDLEEMLLHLESKGVDTKEISIQVDFEGKEVLTRDQFKERVEVQKQQLLNRIKGYSQVAYDKARGYNLKQLQKLEKNLPSEAHEQIHQLADQLIPDLKEVLYGLGYKDEDIRPLALVFAVDLLPMLANPEGHRGRFQRSVKATERRYPTQMGSNIGFKSKKVPFTFVTEMDREGKRVHVQIIPNTKTVLGAGSYGKVKASYSMTLDVASDSSDKPNTIAVDRTAIKRIFKGQNVIEGQNIVENVKMVHQMAEQLDPDTNIIVPIAIREYDSKTGEKRVEIELPLFRGSLYDIASTGFLPSFDGAPTPFDMSSSLDCLIDVGETIAEMHEYAYLHLDLKSANVLVKDDPATGRLTAHTGDFDFLKQGIGLFREHETYPYYDLVGQKGFALPSCDIYGLAAMAGELVFPQFLQKVLYHRDQLYTPEGRTHHFAIGIDLRARQSFERAGFAKDELDLLGIDMDQFKNSSAGPEIVLEQFLKNLTNMYAAAGDPEKKEVIRQVQKDVKAAHAIYSLICEVVEADKNWGERFLQDKELQKKIVGTDEEKEEVLQEMMEYFPLLPGAFVERMREIQEEYKQ